MHRRVWLGMVFALVLGLLAGCGLQSIPQAENKVEAAVAEAESTTSGEIVPLLVRRSST